MRWVRKIPRFTIGGITEASTLLREAYGYMRDPFFPALPVESIFGWDISDLAPASSSYRLIPHLQEGRTRLREGPLPPMPLPPI